MTVFREESLSRVCKRHGEVVVAPSGEIDIATAPMLQQTVDSVFESVGGGRLVFDLTAVDFMDSTGLKAIITAAQLLPGKVTIRNAPRQVRLLLDVSGVGGYVEVEPATRADRPAVSGSDDQSVAS